MEVDDLARPAHPISVLKIIVSAAYLVALFTVSGQYPQLLAGLVFVPVAALTVIRHLRVLTLRPILRATPDSLEVRIWDTRFLVPWVFEERRKIPWRDLLGATVKTLRVNGMDTSSLELRLVNGTCTIEPGVFAENAHELQRRVLDRKASGGAPPGGPPRPQRLAIATRNRTRFATPVVVRSRYSLAGAVTAYVSAVAIAYVGWVISPATWFLWGGAALIALIFGAGMTGRFVMERRVRVIELRADGLAIGPAPGQLRLTPWEDVATARVAVTNGVEHAVHVSTRDGDRFVLHGRYDRSFSELRDLIDPPGPSP